MTVRVALIQLDCSMSEPVSHRVTRTLGWSSGRRRVPTSSSSRRCGMSAPSTSTGRASMRRRSTDRWCQALGALAGEHGIWLHGGSFCELADDGRHYNTSVMFAPDGELVVRYRKIHLFGFEGGETVLMTGGDELVVAETPLGSTGVATCYDLRFPELFRALTDGGASAVVMASGWPSTAHRALGHPDPGAGDREPGVAHRLQCRRLAAGPRAGWVTRSWSTRRGSWLPRAGPVRRWWSRRSTPMPARRGARRSRARRHPHRLTGRAAAGRSGRLGYMRSISASGPTTMTGLRSGTRASAGPRASWPRGIGDAARGRPCRCVTCRKMPPPASVSAGCAGTPDTVRASTDRAAGQVVVEDRDVAVLLAVGPQPLDVAAVGPPRACRRSGRRCTSPAGGGCRSRRRSRRTAGRAGRCPDRRAVRTPGGCRTCPPGVLPVPSSLGAAGARPFQPRRAGVAPITVATRPSPSRS